jgi:Ras and EF-hand domain-containing protein
MRSEIPLTPEQLEAVFDSLDVNKNGYLTIEQFLSGFGKYKVNKEMYDSSARVLEV